MGPQGYVTQSNLSGKSAVVIHLYREHAERSARGKWGNIPAEGTMSEWQDWARTRGRECRVCAQCLAH